MLIITPLEDLGKVLDEHHSAHVCGLLSPQMPHPDLDIPAERRLKLSFHDLARPRAGFIPASEDDVRALVDFAHAWRVDGSGPLVLHCWAGISRSPAAAFIVRCALEPQCDEMELAHTLRTVAPFATPNPLLVELADRTLERGGRMIAAIAAIGRGREAFLGEPFTWR